MNWWIAGLVVSHVLSFAAGCKVTSWVVGLIQAPAASSTASRPRDPAEMAVNPFGEPIMASRYGAYDMALSQARRELKRRGQNGATKAA